MGKVIKGRGAASNDASRFLPTTMQPVDDGWYQEDPPERVATQVYADRTVKLITTNQSPDVPFDQSINPYKGCEHGCIYCFARPTHTFLDLSAGLDFETKLFAKTDAGRHLRIELTKRGYVCRPIAMGTNTDPYQPVEKQRRVMREIMETLLEVRHPLSIVTKSALILRDLDILQEMARLGLVHVHVSVTTLDNELKARLEPRTAGPAARLRTIRELTARGVPTGAMLAPIIPFINDHELEDLALAAKRAGAQNLGYILIRLPLEVAPLFEEWLRQHYPLKADRVMAAIRDTRGGRTYQAKWGERMVGQGQMAVLISSRFHAAAKRVGLEGSRFADLENGSVHAAQASGRSSVGSFLERHSGVEAGKLARFCVERVYGSDGVVLGVHVGLHRHDGGLWGDRAAQGR